MRQETVLVPISLVAEIPEKEWEKCTKLKVKILVERMGSLGTCALDWIELPGNCCETCGQPKPEELVAAQLGAEHAPTTEPRGCQGCAQHYEINWSIQEGWHHRMPDNNDFVNVECTSLGYANLSFCNGCRQRFGLQCDSTNDIWYHPEWKDSFHVRGTKCRTLN